jgi:hypothetical protein
VRLLGTEGAYALQTKLKFWAIYPVQPVDDLISRPTIDIADEPKGDVIIFNVDPPGSGKTTAQQREAHGRVARNFEGGKKSRHHEHSPNLLQV